MSKSFTSIISWFLVPLLLLGHYYTQHPAFVFILGCISTLVIFILAGAFCVILSESQWDPNVHDTFRKLNEFPKWKLLVSRIFQATGCIYLLYAQQFIVFILYFIAAFGVYALWRAVKKLHEE